MPLPLVKFERNYESTKYHIEELFKTEGSETITLSLKDGKLEVKTHLLLLPCEFLRTLLTDTDNCKVIILPDIEKEDMIKMIELITTGNTPYKDKRFDETTDLLHLVLRFDPKDFSFDKRKTWANLDDVFRGVEKKKYKKEKKVPYTPFNVFEKERQVFMTDDFTCKYCLKYFDRKDQLNQHMKMCSKAQTKEQIQDKIKSMKCYSCDTCNMSFRNKESLRQHELTHSEDVEFSCEICEKTYSSLTALRNHCKVENHKYPDPEKFKMLRSQNIPENFQQCEVCGRWVGRMEHHMNTHHSENSRLFECERCDYKTNRRDNFKRHQLDMHKIVDRRFQSIDDTFKGRKPEWTCFDCKITFNSELEIENHILSKHCKDLKCNICDKTYKKHQHLVQHIRSIHENPQRYVCSKCGKSYAHKRTLTKHLKKCLN